MVKTYLGTKDDVLKGKILYGECSTAAATAAKTVTISGFKKIEGITVAVKFLYSNTAAGMTLNINGTGAEKLLFHGVEMSDDFIEAKGIYVLTFDGQYYQLVET